MILSSLPWDIAVKKIISLQFDIMNDLEKRVLVELIRCSVDNGMIVINEELRGKISDFLDSSVASIANSVSRLGKAGALVSMGKGSYRIVNIGWYPSY